MERGGKVNYHRELNDTEKDHKIIDSVLERFESYDSFEVDAAKAKKFVEEKRHKIKRPVKKPTKIIDNQINKVNKTEQLTLNKSTSNKTDPVMNFRFKSDDETYDNLDEEIKQKSTTKKPINKVQKEKVNDNSESSESEEVLSKIQLLNQELFKENSNKSRNETIKNAWKTLSEYELPDKDNLIIKKSHPGHFVTHGCCSGSIRNPHWLVTDKSEEEYYIMYCETNAYTTFSIEDYKDVINPIENKYPTWHIEKIGYIQTKNYITRTTVYLHQVICKKHNEKKYSTLSVDHKNRDKLDNRKENLRFATQSEQNQNTDKRNRKYNAKKLPEGLKQEDMPKYVLYYSEIYGTNKDKFREWLNIEKHPKQYENRRWSTSKSMAITIQEKLDQAKAKLKELVYNL